MTLREHAADIALADALEHTLGFCISQVMRIGEIKGMLPIAYPVKLHGCWIAYVEQEFTDWLAQSTIILVDCKTGKLVYRGGANDEG
jgi:hypothetical protein